MNHKHDFSHTVAEMHRLSKELHDGEYAPNASEFEYYLTGDAAGRSTICNAFGAWGNFVEFCGLKMADRKYYFAAFKRRGISIDAQKQAEAADAETRMDAVAEKTEHLLAKRRRALDDRYIRDGITVFDTPRVDVAYVPGVGMVARLAWLVK